ncbi:DEAD/DEAH box helicase [Legionella saoudiensis]|uniref:DEAD/DEAH box helicase n=1 Tax=Legionella saoudiensis TaxID=1750561 RepID=UPI00098F9646|nr:DEAD/DEAH box helicase family protein [Legionella saoudiensis]
MGKKKTPESLELMCKRYGELMGKRAGKADNIGKWTKIPADIESDSRFKSLPLQEAEKYIYIYSLAYQKASYAHNSSSGERYVDEIKKTAMYYGSRMARSYLHPSSDYPQKLKEASEYKTALPQVKTQYHEYYKAYRDFYYELGKLDVSEHGKELILLEALAFGIGSAHASVFFSSIPEILTRQDLYHKLSPYLQHKIYLIYLNPQEYIKSSISEHIAAQYLNLREPIIEGMELGTAVQDEIVQTPDDSTTTTTTTTTLSVNPEPAISLHNEVRGGIHSKYITGIPHPQLPRAPFFFRRNAAERQEIQFIPIHNNITPGSDIYSQNILGITFVARLISLDANRDPRQISTFICAGRKANALVPLPSQGRCALICTEEELDEIIPHLSEHHDILVIDMIDSNYNGLYTQLNSITARRIAAFLFAFHFALDEFIMLDDNIEKISLKSDISPISSWDDVFGYLKEQLGQNASLSVATMNGRRKKPGELGSKFFMVNMKLIRELLQDEEQLIVLFPHALQADKWGEDYYFQIFLHYLFEKINIPGYSIMPLEDIGLLRSKKNRNFFAMSGKKAELFAEHDQLDSIPKELAQILNCTVKKLNQIINDNYKQHAALDKFLEDTDLLGFHSLANAVEERTSSSFLNALATNDDFKLNFYKLINEYDFEKSMLRDYQAQAIKAVPQVDIYPARLTLATGSGKSIIQLTLALMAYHASTKNQRIFIVTPQIDLVRQLYKDMREYNELLHKQNDPLAISPSDIVTISSHTQSLSVSLVRKNNLFKKQKSIVICCEDSFNKLLKEDLSVVMESSLILLDEYHEYSLSVKQLVDILPPGGPLTIASSATPPADDIIQNTLYSFSLTDALNGPYHASIIACPLNVSYSKENVQNLIKCLPLILQNQYHPGGEDENALTLAESKGIIYLESIKLCEQAQLELSKAGIRAYAIHSNNQQSSEEVREFVADSSPGVLLAVRKLRFGFDCRDLAWEIIARKPSQKAAEQDIEQMLGRVIRPYKNKIGFIITFQDIYHTYLAPLIKNQHKKSRVSIDFLAHEIEYHLFTDGTCKLIDLDLEELENPMQLVASEQKSSPGFFSHKRKHSALTDKPDVLRLLTTP